MEKLRFVGLDVHKDKIVIAVAEAGRGEAMVLATIPHDLKLLAKRLRKLGAPASLLVCYEAGPTGFGLSRFLDVRGIECLVVAPSLVPVKKGARVKTDRRDAVKLAHFLRSGDLTEIYVPDEETEAIRDLERTRGDAKAAERTARQHLLKFLQRHGRRYTGRGNNWTVKHLDWIRRQKFEHEAQQVVLVDYLKTVEDTTERVSRLTDELAKQAEKWTLAPQVKALQALRGVQLVTAVTIMAEVGDLTRFPHPEKLMSYLGLVPSEFSTGDSVRRGKITRTGNKHVRRVLVESAWAYHYQPRMSVAIRARNEAVSEEVRKIAWKAQLRLNAKYRRLLYRGKEPQKVATAVARELVGFIWDIARQEHLLAQET